MKKDAQTQRQFVLCLILHWFSNINTGIIFYRWILIAEKYVWNL